MLVITVPKKKQVVLEKYHFIEGDMVPLHDGAYVEPPCCTVPDPDTGMISCGCGGYATIVCPASDCPGFSDIELEELTERLL